ncbi:hypothetical protein C0991_005396 [Blastosporella zonata]|nr:hypothetical protein C0991_005396 [Blastosporella zonata]
MDVLTLFASNLRTFSNNAITDLQYAGLTRDKPLLRKALQVAAGLFKMWDQHPKRLQDEDWAEETAVMEAGQELWTMWSLKEWAQEMPYYKFFSVAMVPGQRPLALADINMTDTQEMPLFEEDNKDFETSLVRKPYSTSESLRKRKAHEILGGVNMDSGPSSARPAKVSKTGPGQPSTKPAKVPIDILGAHATDKDSVDEGLEGDIAVHVRWSTRALVRLAPHSERLEFWEAKGPCQQCTTAKEFGRGHHTRHPTLGARGEEEGEEDGGARLGRGRGGSRGRAFAHHSSAANTEDNMEEVLGEGTLGVPKLDKGDDSAPVAPEGVEGDRASESAKSVWRPTDKPPT